MIRPPIIATPICRPSTQTIYNLGETIITRLFHKRYNGHIIRYTAADIVQLLNYISTNTTHIPDDINTRWGDAIMTVSAPKAVLQQFGIRGTAEQQHNKQAIVSSLIVTDDNGNIINKKFIRNMLPHKSTKGAYSFMDKCGKLRNKFENECCGILCDMTKYSRQSMHIYLFHL